MILLGALLGLGISAMLTWSSFIFFDQLVTPYVIGINIALAGGLGYFAHRRNGLLNMIDIKALDLFDYIGLALIIALTIPTFIHATLFPYGGWDAWSCWNLKAKFLFAGADAWRNMFDPLLWRSNISYPLLLPLINTWMWCFGSTVAPEVPMAISCLITALTAGILLFSLKETLQKPWAAFIAPVLIFTCLFNIKLASSQYSDLLVGVLFLAAIVLFSKFIKTKGHGYLILEAISLGLLSFTKTEGMLLAVITAALSAITLIMLAPKEQKQKDLNILLGACAIAFIPTAAFMIFMAPDSHTFINGLSSWERPANWDRTQAIAFFFGHEMIDMKWNGFWLVCLTGLILGGRNAFKKEWLFIPVAIIAYLGAISAFYYVNTFFEVAWWLSTTLNRVLFSLIPAMAYWTFIPLNEK
jgi:hypothetical protein